MVIVRWNTSKMLVLSFLRQKVQMMNAFLLSGMCIIWLCNCTPNGDDIIGPVPPHVDDQFPREIPDDEFQFQRYAYLDFINSLVIVLTFDIQTVLIAKG